jgi:hypothetical protein
MWIINILDSPVDVKGDYDGFTVVVTATSSHVPVTAGNRFPVRPGVATVPQIDADERR